MLLLKKHSLKHKEIGKKLGLTPSKLTYHLNILEDNEIIDVCTYGREKGYSLKDRKEIVRILNNYILKIELHIAIEEFKNAWNE